MPDVDKLDPSDHRAPYLQLADVFRRAINDGELKAGDKLPGLDTVATEYGVARGTARRAFEQLQTEKLIVIRHGQGSFVLHPRPPEPEQGLSEELTAIRDQLAEFDRRLSEIEQRLSDLSR
jgi:DNA-binding GntR family transcriptional regulator